MNNEFKVVYESEYPDMVYAGGPGITKLPNGRLICTMNLIGNGDFNEPFVQYEKNTNKFVVGKVFVSDDKGETWQFKSNFPFYHARPFVAGNTVYILGHCDDLYITRSTDGGETWSNAVPLTQGEQWHQTAANVCYKNNYVYMVMERIMYDDCKAWPVSVLAPVLIRADINDDLLKRKSWTFANELAFRDAVDQEKLDYFGVPFYKTPKKRSLKIEGDIKVAPMGWLETNVVQIYDKNHYWYDENTFYLFSRAHTAGTGYCALSKVVEKKDGSMHTELVEMPSGVKAAFLPMPGGHMRFHIIYDEKTKLFWLLSSQATDSMTKADCLPEGRFGMPNNERNRLQLHFSKNCVDWCFATMVSIGEKVKESRHYASMVIDGDNLCIVSRSGNEKAYSAHDVNLITYHIVKDFRLLIY